MKYVLLAAAAVLLSGCALTFTGNVVNASLVNAPTGSSSNQKAGEIR